MKKNEIDRSTKRIIILTSILASLCITLLINLLEYGLPAAAFGPGLPSNKEGVLPDGGTISSSSFQQCPYTSNSIITIGTCSSNAQGWMAADAKATLLANKDTTFCISDARSTCLAEEDKKFTLLGIEQKIHHDNKLIRKGVVSCISTVFMDYSCATISLPSPSPAATIGRKRITGICTGTGKGTTFGKAAEAAYVDLNNCYYKAIKDNNCISGTFNGGNTDMTNEGGPGNWTVTYTNKKDSPWSCWVLTK